MIVALAVLLLPRAALATYAQCGDDELSLDVPDEAVSRITESQTAPDDLIDDEAAPAMSLREGASAVAPKPIHAPSDAHIEAAKKPCFDGLSDSMKVQSPDERSIDLPSAAMDAALQAVPSLPHLPGQPRWLDRRPPTSPPTALPTSIERPPRA
ncbi:MAG: hypothetical protein KC731_23105 [Myxococcales bacterium]|nr:hypothetical protein [Myxococcales bacterium]